MKILKTLIVTVIFAVLIMFTALSIVKANVAGVAQDKITQFVQSNKDFKVLDEVLLKATLYAHEESKKTSAEPNSFYEALRPYITSNILPEIVRVPADIFDIAYPAQGNATVPSSLLTHILKRLELNAQQWEIISPRESRSAVIVKTEDGAGKYLDPLSGAVAMYENKIIIGPYAARHLMLDNIDHKTVFVNLYEGADLDFYKDFAHVMLAPPGYPLYISVAAPVLEEPLVLGAVDGSSEDVISAASEWLLTPYLNYIGQKHGEHVKRSVYFTEAAKVTFVLGGAYDPSLIVSNIEPQVDGQTLVFEVQEDEALVFEDGQAPADQFIPVDQIIIEQL